MKKITAALSQFRNLIKEGYYFEAHECLEDIWRSASKEDPLKAVLKGYINGAVTLTLIQKERPETTYAKPWIAYQNARHATASLQPALWREFLITGNLLECHYAHTHRGIEIKGLCKECFVESIHPA